MPSLFEEEDTLHCKQAPVQEQPAGTRIIDNADYTHKRLT